MDQGTATTAIEGMAEVERTLRGLQTQLSALSARLERLEAAVAAAGPSRAPAAEPAPREARVGEEELLVISAALAAYLGVRVRIRQARLVDSPAWAMLGRVSIQASHRLHDHGGRAAP